MSKHQDESKERIVANLLTAIEHVNKREWALAIDRIMAALSTTITEHAYAKADEAFQRCNESWSKVMEQRRG